MSEPAAKHTESESSIPSRKVALPETPSSTHFQRQELNGTLSPPPPHTHTHTGIRSNARGITPEAYRIHLQGLQENTVSRTKISKTLPENDPIQSQRVFSSIAQLNYPTVRENSLIVR
jgi:hypothetical protein